VRPGLLVVRLSFDLPMACQGSLGTGFMTPNPCASEGLQRWSLSYDRLNLRVLCRVKARAHYELWVNHDTPEDFRGLGGRRPTATELTFDTSDEAPVATVEEAVALAAR
jgi:hypothetical protein